MRLLSLFLAVVLVAACIEVGDQQSARGKFIAEMQLNNQAIYSSSLITKVNSPAITIMYGFVPECASKYSDTQVKSDVERVLRLWLKPLRDWSERPSNQPVVDTFIFERGSTYDSKIIEPANKATIYGMASSLNTDFTITFYCREGRSYMFKQRDPREIHMYDEKGQYSLATLMHEVGHVFGLADTYVDPTNITGGKNRFNTSICGSKRMVGCQPLSVMSITNWLIEDDNSLKLGEDDIAGIRWLYRYQVDGSVQCPVGYVAEQSTRGCVPQDLLDFALQQGDYDNAIELMIEQGLPLDTQDDKGNTILHYAAQRAASHGGHAYARAVEAGASPDLANYAGDTPRKLLFPAIKEAMQRNEIYIAADLIARAID